MFYNFYDKKQQQYKYKVFYYWTKFSFIYKVIISYDIWNPTQIITKHLIKTDHLVVKFAHFFWTIFKDCWFQGRSLSSFKKRNWTTLCCFSNHNVVCNTAKASQHEGPMLLRELVVNFSFIGIDNLYPLLSKMVFDLLKLSVNSQVM